MATAYLDKHVECAICFEVFRNPHALTCLHTYCLECIQQLDTTNGNVECPECRAATHLDKIKKDFKTGGIVDTYKSQKGNEDVESMGSESEITVRCDLCKNKYKEVKVKCEDCEEILCDDCKTAHSACKLTKDHMITPITDIIEQNKVYVNTLNEKLQDILSQVRRGEYFVTRSIKRIKQSQVNQTCEVNMYIDDILSRLKTHRETLLDTITIKNESVIEDLKTRGELFQNHEKKLLDGIATLQKVQNSNDKQLFIEIHSIIDDEFNKEVDHIKACVVHLEPSASSPLNLMHNKDWNLENCLFIQENKAQANKSSIDKKFTLMLLEGSMEKQLMRNQANISCRRLSRHLGEESINKELLDLHRGSSRRKSLDVEPQVSVKELDANKSTQPKPSLKANSSQCPKPGIDSKIYTDISKCVYSQNLKHKSEHKNYIQNICLVDNNLWCNVFDSIHVYNQDINIIKEIKHPQINCIKGMVLDDNGHVIVTCSNNIGVHQLDDKGIYMTQLMKGNYSGVSAYNGQIFVLKYDSCQVYILSFQNNQWVPTHVLQLEYEDSDDNDRLLVNSFGIYISSWFNACVYIYDSRGNLRQTAGKRGSGEPGRLQHARLCGTDTEGNVLVADDDNHRLQVFKRNMSTWEVITLDDIGCPMDALVEGNNAQIWVCTDDKHLLKYKKVEQAAGNSG